MKVDQLRYNQLLNLGRRVADTAHMELSRSQMRRECCRQKRDLLLGLHKSQQAFKRHLWDFRDHFDRIDEAVHAQEPTNPIINKEALQDYVHNSFLHSEEVADRRKRV